VVAAQAYDRCLQLARAHYENFPVASRLLPRPMRPHIAAVYAFARIADDFADEGARSRDERLALLDDWSRRLTLAASGRPAADESDAGAVFVALAATMQAHRLEPALFDALLSAFRQDVLACRYETWDDVIDYCRRSANPVGRIVLRIAGYRDATRDAASDAVCTALQFTNFWQDLERDWAKGRVYVPQSVLREHGAAESALAARRMTPEWRAALAACTQRTREFFADGRRIPDLVAGRLRWELRATWHGGMRILERLEAVGFDVFRARPTLGARDLGLIAWRAVWW
jgi:squalene synthase HpnC